MSKASRIAAILADQDFCDTVTRAKAELTQKVMARATSGEDRADAMAEYHALDRLMARLRAVASDMDKEST